jgi:hypothetical protein
MNPERGGHLESKCASSISFREGVAPPSGCITLLTDFGLSDAYVGVMKGVISRINPRATVIDLCHQVIPQNIREAAFLLGASYSFFPPGAVHVAVVDPTVGGKRRALCVAAGNFIFVGPDNGVLSLACSRAGIKEIRSLRNEAYFLENVSRTFHGRDIFAPVAAHVSSGVPLAKLGPKLRSMKQLELSAPKVGPGRRICGMVIHTDRFGNLITNIDDGTFARVFDPVERRKLTVQIAGVTIRGVSETYADVLPGMAAALFGSYNLLEIAVREGSAADELRAGEGAEVVLEAPRR